MLRSLANKLILPPNILKSDSLEVLSAKLSSFLSYLLSSLESISFILNIKLTPSK